VACASGPLFRWLRRGPELVPLEVLTDAVVRFVEDETLAGRVVLLDRGAEPRFLD
jgi:hypothetical protein